MTKLPVVSGESVLETQALTKRYRRTVAVRDLSIAIPAGGITALLGPNGAGKSTLLKMCIGFERPTAGRLSVFGIDPVRRRRDALNMLGYVPQAPSLYRDMRVEDHFRLARALRRAFDIPYARDRVTALGISPAATAGQLSGGEQAQVALAIALATRAPLLLLDEPLASLDPLARREFLEVASEAAKTGDISIVLSSHVISEIESVADRLLVLGEGRVLFEDSVASSLGQHRVIDDGTPVDGLDVVARFPGQGSSRHLLVRSTDPSIGRPGSLEEVVIGYLALGRRAA
jgi:ABC-2 type transport system ATP-binding protein